jgi:hypothetical protein
MKRARGFAACLSIVLTLSAAAPARAIYDPLASGTTVLELDKSFLGLLRAHDVVISAREGAGLRGGALRFPVSGGKFDPRTRRGTVEHAGAVVFRRGNRTVPLKGLQLRTTRRSSPLVAKLGGGQLKLGPARRLKVVRRGFGEKITVTSMRLTDKFATRLSRRLKLRDVLEEGMPVGSAVTRADPATVAVLAKGTAQLELDPAMTAKLADLHVAVNPIFPAERPGPFALPIFSGKLALDLRSDYLQLAGALELLQLGGGQVFWKEPVLDLAGGTLGLREGGALAALDLDTGAAVSDLERRTLGVTNATLRLIGPTAALLNQAFAEPKARRTSSPPANLSAGSPSWLRHSECPALVELRARKFVQLHIAGSLRQDSAGSPERGGCLTNRILTPLKQ